MSELTYERLREMLNYDQETDVWTWRKSPQHKTKVGDVAGGKSRKTSDQICIDGRNYMRRRLAYMYVNGAFPEGRLKRQERIEMSNDTLKRCSRCHESKPRSEYASNRSTTDKLQRACKPCQAQYRQDGLTMKRTTTTTTVEIKEEWINPSGHVLSPETIEMLKALRAAKEWGL
jgi:hypothetical protein